MQDSFYIANGETFISTESTRGPWSLEHQHAGPPAALLARAMEQAVGAGFRFVRVNVEIPRPVPIAELRVESKIDRAGRSVQYASAELFDMDGKLCMQATGVAMRETEVELPEYQLHDDRELPGPDTGENFSYPFFAPDFHGYDNVIDKRLADGEFLSGRCAVWMNMTIPLVAGEETSPLQRVMTVADSGSGVSMALHTDDYVFMNPDLTVYLRRYPVGEWVCLDGTTVPHESGIGLASTHLRDAEGLIGEGLQSLLVNKR